MTQKKIGQKPQLQVDILKEEIDLILIKNGLKPTVWGDEKGFVAYFPKQRKKGDFHKPTSSKKF